MTRMLRLLSVERGRCLYEAFGRRFRQRMAVGHRDLTAGRVDDEARVNGVGRGHRVQSLRRAAAAGIAHERRQLRRPIPVEAGGDRRSVGLGLHQTILDDGTRGSAVRVVVAVAEAVGGDARTVDRQSHSIDQLLLQTVDVRRNPAELVTVGGQQGPRPAELLLVGPPGE